jgi:hypothetical protein
MNSFTAYRKLEVLNIAASVRIGAVLSNETTALITDTAERRNTQRGKELQNPVRGRLPVAPLWRRPTLLSRAIWLCAITLTARLRSVQSIEGKT